ncbi:MAG: amidohydrolase family protein [Gammaproteobacteria bacterium]|jgi:hypothetical protein|nr:amidohydrolase family protein [Gammaproteobacteria bacterium]
MKEQIPTKHTSGAPTLVNNFLRLRLITKTLLTVGLCCTLLGCAKNPDTQESPKTMINNVNVVDPVDGLIAQQQVVIQEDKIVYVGPIDKIKTADSDIIIDATGQFLMPGLWDMHVHFLYDEALTDTMPELFLRYGVTSVRDTGGDVKKLAALREALKGIPAPRIYFSGPLLDGEFVIYDGSDPSRPPLGASVLNAESAMSTVSTLKTAGADFIKIYELIDPATYSSLAAAAKEFDMPIAAHVPLMMTADIAGPIAGSMEHLRNIELACAVNWQELLTQRQAAIAGFTEGLGYTLRSDLHSAQRIPAINAYDETRCNEVLDTLTNTIQVPTLRLNTILMLKPFERPDWPSAATALPQKVLENWQASIAMLDANNLSIDHTFANWSQFLIARLLERGVPIGAGTDAPIGFGIPGYSLHTELELLVAGGMSTRQAIYAATVTPAKFLGLEDTMGQIKADMAADLVLLSENPLENIEHSRSIINVMSRGLWVE